MSRTFDYKKLNALCREQNKQVTDKIKLAVPYGYTEIDVLRKFFGLDTGEECFGHSLVSVHLPETVTHIHEQVFDFSNVTEINFPSSLTHIGCSAFYTSKLKKADLSKCTGLTTIPRFCFALCTSLEEVFLPDNVTEIRESAFSGNKYARYSREGSVHLKKVSIPVGLTEIGQSAFSYNYALTVYIRLRS